MRCDRSTLSHDDSIHWIDTWKERGGDKKGRAIPTSRKAKDAWPRPWSSFVLFCRLAVYGD